MIEGVPISYKRNEVRKKNKKREFPIPLGQLSWAVYFVDWKELVNPFLVSKLCRVVGFEIEPENIFGPELPHLILGEYPEFKYDPGLPRL